ncbi:hypothetical protein QCA50_005126 [Cerrena zonata]|uniref:Uncharacterized protein n=1 Tax=Cerrena zonata TaxID=2478898 RepID=A0AAW0GQB5_9APHY
MSRATPTKTAPNGQSDNSNAPELKDLLGPLNKTLGTLDKSFEAINKQSEKLSSVGPNINDAEKSLNELTEKVKKQEKKQEVQVQKVKSMIQVDLMDKMGTEMQAFIEEEIKKQIALQVREQVRDQLKEHIPLSLEERVHGSHEQVVRVRHALQNSEARRHNASLETDNLYDELKVVLKPDGTKSTKWPIDLQTMFSYTTAMLRDLMRDYELSDYGSREKNLNRFMSHIGIRFQLVQLPEEGQ